MKKDEKAVGLPEAEKSTLYEQIKETLAVASHFIIAAPWKLPPSVVMAARYLALALGVLEAVENGVKKGGDDAD